MPSITLPAPDPNLRAAPPTPAAADALVQYNLDRINALRATKKLPPLVHDAAIAAFARAGSEQLARDHNAHAHFAANTKRPPPGFGNRMAENQGDPGGVFVMDKDPTANGRKQIDVMIKLMFDEGPGGGHYDNMMNPLFRKVGIGLVYVADRLYMTNDFSN